MNKEKILNLIDGFIDDFEQKNIMRYEIAKVIYSALESAGCLKEVSKDSEPAYIPMPHPDIEPTEHSKPENIQSSVKIDVDRLCREAINAIQRAAKPQPPNPLDELEKWVEKQSKRYDPDDVYTEHMKIVLSKIRSLRSDE